MALVCRLSTTYWRRHITTWALFVGTKRSLKMFWRTKSAESNRLQSLMSWMQLGSLFRVKEKIHSSSRPRDKMLWYGPLGLPASLKSNVSLWILKRIGFWSRPWSKIVQNNTFMSPREVSQDLITGSQSFLTSTETIVLDTRPKLSTTFGWAAYQAILS